MIYLHKILPLIFLPIMMVIIIVIIGLNKNNKKYVYTGIGLLYILSTPLFSNFFFKLIEGSEYIKSVRLIESANAIVVLSGMLEINEFRNKNYVEWKDPDRFFAGIGLFKEGKAPKLVFTGGKNPWSTATKTEGEVLKVFAISSGIQPEKIFVTKNVENTAEEASAVKELISPFKRIILVTSAFHMYRAKMLFESQGFIVIPYMVDYKTSPNSAIKIMDFLPSAKNLELSEAGLRELIGRLFYKVKTVLSLLSC
jgi:uncharacterized SAM-binding protein YcdF (DUF218 family)